MQFFTNLKLDFLYEYPAYVLREIVERNSEIGEFENFWRLGHVWSHDYLFFSMLVAWIRRSMVGLGVMDAALN